MKELDGVQGHKAGKGLMDKAMELVASWDRFRDRFKERFSSQREWRSDLRWAFNMIRVRRWRRYLNDNQRQRFDASLCHNVTDGFRMEYPSAFYCVTAEDVDRAFIASIDSGWDETIRWGNYGTRYEGDLHHELAARTPAAAAGDDSPR
jgi:hypothetical protein